MIRNSVFFVIGLAVASGAFLWRYEPNLGFLKKPPAPPDFCVRDFQATEVRLAEGGAIVLAGEFVKGDPSCVYLNMTATLERVPVEVSFEIDRGTLPAGEHAFAGWKFRPAEQTEGQMRIVALHRIEHPDYRQEVRETVLAVIGYPPD